MIGFYFEKQSIQHAFIHYAEGRLFFLLDLWALDMCGGTGQTERWVLARPNRPKIAAIGQTEGQPKIFSDHFSWVAPRPLFRELSQSVWPIPVLGREPHPGGVRKKSSSHLYWGTSRGLNSIDLDRWLYTSSQLSQCQKFLPCDLLILSFWSGLSCYPLWWRHESLTLPANNWKCLTDIKCMMNSFNHSS